MPVKFIPQKWDEDVDDNEEDDEPNHAKPIMGDLRFDLHPWKMLSPLALSSAFLSARLVRVALARYGSKSVWDS